MSMEINNNNIINQNNSVDSYNKKRARIACNSCRQKKIKCDGKLPCLNCSNNSNSDCNYTERLRRRTKKEILESISKNGQMPSKNLNHISDRVAKLEDLIVSLSTKIDHKNTNKSISIPLQNKAIPDNSNNLNGDFSSSDLDKYHCPGVQSQHSHSKFDNVLEERKNSQFIGSHCIISIFSDKSMKWIENALSPSDAYLTNSIKNLPRIVHTNIHNFINVWLNPPKLTKQEYTSVFENPFPKNPEIVFGFIESQYSISMLENICEKKVTLELFEEYYSPKRKRKFKSSELLLMTMTLALCICSKIDECLSSRTNTPASSNGTTSSIDMLSPDDLLKMHTDLFNKAIHYYHNVSLVHEGLITIQGILFLIFYIETNHLFTFISFTLISVAIRIAQSLGMHRTDGYNKLSATECERRLAVWTFCNFLDIEISFRTGKPPLRSSFDVSPALDEMVNRTFTSRLNCNKRLGFFTKSNLAKYFYYFELLDRIRFRSYTELFSASTKSKTTDVLIRTLDNLNYEMFKLASDIDYEIRPILQNDPTYHPLPDNLGEEERMHMLKIHLTYFSNLIIINRVPSLLNDTSFFRNPNEITKYRDFTLNAARSILLLNLTWNRDTTSFSFYLYSLFHSITGYMALSAFCINHPDLPTTYNDIQLLKSFSISVYECHLKWTLKESVRKHFQGLILVSLILRILLLFSVKAYEYKVGVLIIESDLSLKSQIESLEIECPDIYHDPNSFKVPRHIERYDMELKPHIASDPDMRSDGALPTNSTMQGHYNGRSLESRSPMPVSNLLNPNVPTPSSTPNVYNELLYGNNPDLGYSVFSQMTNFPNFFFDNNLGI